MNDPSPKASYEVYVKLHGSEADQKKYRKLVRECRWGGDVGNVAVGIAELCRAWKGYTPAKFYLCHGMDAETLIQTLAQLFPAATLAGHVVELLGRDFTTLSEQGGIEYRFRDSKGDDWIGRPGAYVRPPAIDTDTKKKSGGEFELLFRVPDDFVETAMNLDGIAERHGLNFLYGELVEHGLRLHGYAWPDQLDEAALLAEIAAAGIDAVIH